MRRLAQVLTWLMVPLSSLAAAQQPLPTIKFDSIPEGAQLVSNPIGLEGDVNVTGDLDVTGEIRTGIGIRFPDGSLQVTAASPAAGSGLTANSGLYGNTIADFSPPLAYTEVCFKGGAVAFDVHATGETTAGGNCVPGDIGWIIERFERGGEEDFSWTEARAACLMFGMRLLEPFEWQFSCDNAGTFQLSNMINGLEWVSNTATLLETTTVAAPLFGKTNCLSAERGVIGNTNDNQSRHLMRCGR